MMDKQFRKIGRNVDVEKIPIWRSVENKLCSCKHEWCVLRKFWKTLWKLLNICEIDFVFVCVHNTVESCSSRVSHKTFPPTDPCVSNPKVRNLPLENRKLSISAAKLTRVTGWRLTALRHLLTHLLTRSILRR